MKPPRVVLLASGRGSNARAIWESTRKGELPAQWVACLTNRPQAGVIEIAEQAGVICTTIEKTEVLEARLIELKPDWVVLAGYMRKLSGPTIEAFRDAEGWSRIVNIHPSLLPAFRGLRAYQQAWDAGAQVAGATVHLVEAEVDSGPIVAQEAFAIDDCQSAEQVEARGVRIEHGLYPAALRRLFAGGRPRVRSS